MSHDGSIASKIEEAIIAKIAVCQFNGDDAFKTVGIWEHQVTPDKASIEAMQRFTPFAFVAYQPAFPGREGDGDLRLVYDLAIYIGQVSAQDGVARHGDATHPGTNALEDLVIAALDNVHPGDGIACDDMTFAGSELVVEFPRHRMILMAFKINRMKVS